MDEDQKPAPRRNRFEMVGELVSIFLRGDVWYANYQLNGRQHRRSLGTRSEKQARVLALRVENDIIEGRYRGPTRPCSISEASAAYLQSLRAEGRRPKTLHKYQAVLKRVQALAERRRLSRLTDLTLSFIDAYRHERVSVGRKPKTIYTEIVVIRQVVNFAMSRKMISVDPLEGSH